MSEAQGAGQEALHGESEGWAGSSEMDTGRPGGHAKVLGQAHITDLALLRDERGPRKS